jgi:glycine/D-amino acid oxidase-like deaminating enzyme
MSTSTADVVICGAGIAGISTAYHLSVNCGISNVVIVDRGAPLSLTSDKSTECYRNWWPGPGDGMVKLMNRSIDLLEKLAYDSNNSFHMNRRGYLFATADENRVKDFIAQAEEAESLGAGPMRLHNGSPDDPAYQPAPSTGFDDQPIGADVITDPDLIREHFPYLTEETVGVVHPRRAGWFSAQQLGQLLLDRAKERGALILEGEVEAIQFVKDRVRHVQVATPQGSHQIHTRNFVNAAGPYLKHISAMVGVELPVFCEYHAKISIHDSLGVFPRSAPLLIWTDAQHLPWSKDERESLYEDQETRFLLDEFPEGVHGRPEGPEDSPVALMLWTYHLDPVEPIFPPIEDPFYPEITMRGMTTMIPGLKKYLTRPPKPYVDGGYYTKTKENRPLVGPLPAEGAWILGALSGYGLMAAPAAGELLANQIAGNQTPDHARWFLPQRYDDPEYVKLLKNWGRSGQL